jgi:YHS domain-containing protein
VTLVAANTGCNGDRGAASNTQRGVQLMERDVVCGMQVDPAKAAGSSEYNGKTYYFCSKSCKTKFDANPGQFAK